MPARFPGTHSWVHLESLRQEHLGRLAPLIPPAMMNSNIGPEQGIFNQWRQRVPHIIVKPIWERGAKQGTGKGNDSPKVTKRARLEPQTEPTSMASSSLAPETALLNIRLSIQTAERGTASCDPEPFISPSVLNHRKNQSCYSRNHTSTLPLFRFQNNSKQVIHLQSQPSPWK